MAFFSLFNFFKSNNLGIVENGEMTDTTSIRLPVAMLKEIEAQRIEENRTKNLQITHLLKIGLDYNRSQLESLRQLGHEHYLLLQRLHYVFAAMCKLTGWDKPLTLPLLAEMLGHPNVEKVDAWFSGKLIPDFADLEQMADLFYVSVDFLKFGNKDFAPFNVHHSSVIRDPKEFVRYLLGLSDKKLQQIKLVRSESGYVAVSLMYNSTQWATVDFPNYRLRKRDDVGGTGFADLVTLAVICYVLSKNSSRVSVFGYSLNDELFTELRRGKIHPAELFYYESKYKCHWDETIWDAGDLRNLSKNTGSADCTFWPGATELFREIQESISYEKLLEKYRDSDELKEIGQLLWQLNTEAA